MALPIPAHRLTQAHFTNPIVMRAIPAPMAVVVAVVAVVATKCAAGKVFKATELKGLQAWPGKSITYIWEGEYFHMAAIN